MCECVCLSAKLSSPYYTTPFFLFFFQECDKEETLFFLLRYFFSSWLGATFGEFIFRESPRPYVNVKREEGAEVRGSSEYISGAEDPIWTPPRVVKRGLKRGEKAKPCPSSKREMRGPKGPRTPPSSIEASPRRNHHKSPVEQLWQSCHYLVRHTYTGCLPWGGNSYVVKTTSPG